MEGGRKGGREREREGGREQGRERGREGGMCVCVGMEKVQVLISVLGRQWGVEVWKEGSF